MDGANGVRTRGTLRHALAGLEAGVLGALVMIFCLAACAALSRRSIWIVPNLFATTFYGPNAYRNQLLRTSWSGAALLLAIYSLGGIVWGLAWRDGRRPLIVLYGAITGLVVYFAFFDLIWKHGNPLIPLYAPLRQLQVAHVLWGMLLARSPGYSRRIALVTGGDGRAKQQVLLQQQLESS